MNKNQFLIFMPVVETGEKSCQCLKGLVAEVFNIKKFIEADIDNTNIEHLVIKISDGKSQGQQQAIFQSNNIQ